MKKIAVVIIILVLLLTQLVATVGAASSQDLDIEKCGYTYKVMPNDNLTRISQYCGVPVSTLISLNPQFAITPDLHPGQILRLSDIAPVNYALSYAGYATTNGSVRISLSTIRLMGGEDMIVRISGFPANAAIEYRVGEFGQAFSIAYEEYVDSEGNGGISFKMPSDADVGEKWVISAQTTSEPQITKIYSQVIRIFGDTVDERKTSKASVKINKVQACAGDVIRVTVSGFPVGAHIDYRVGKYGLNYSTVYDGLIDEEGNASQVVTIPAEAKVGEKWVVHVQTTSHIVGTDVNSPMILIIEKPNN
jgi:hypothetical protein